MTTRIRVDRALKLVGMLACVGFLGGCGGVEFEGKVFDYMGIAGERQEADVKMQARAPLMVPPNLTALPQPSEGAGVATARQDWPDDPEKVRKRVAKQEADIKAKKAAEQDPINPYAGKETLLDQLFSRNETVEEPVSDVPEPDASDRVPDNSVAQARPTPLTPHTPQAPVPDRSAFEPNTPDSYNDVSGGQNTAF